MTANSQNKEEKETKGRGKIVAGILIKLLLSE